MKKFSSSILFCALFLVMGCRETESLDLTQFSLESGKVDAGTECSLIELKTGERKGAFVHRGGGDICTMLGSFDGKVFVRISPSATGGAFYQNAFNMYEIDVKTGLSKWTCNLNSFIDADSSHAPYERAFCMKGQLLYVQNFKTNSIDVVFFIPQEFDTFGDVYLSRDGSMIVLAAAQISDDWFDSARDSASILLGDMLNGEIKEIYSSANFTNILGFQGKRIQFTKSYEREGDQECSADIKGEDIQCGSVKLEPGSWKYRKVY